ncbi:MAG: nuclear transport factor 2 family protein [Actinobacteria bacterium]|nr:nuclear transport factor 2 family protein [Actinomycetota bacterium]
MEKCEDRVSIEDLVKKYCLYFDTNQPEKIIELFTEDVLIDYGPEVPPLKSKAAALAMFTGGLDNLFAQTSHHLSNFILDFDSPESAHSTSYVYAWHRYHHKSEIGYLWGHYHHKFTYALGVWKISELKLFAVHIENFHREKMHPVARH